MFESKLSFRGFSLISCFMLMMWAFRPAAASVIVVDHPVLNFGSDLSGNVTPAQTLLINNSVQGTFNWTVSSNSGWLFVSPTSGSGPGIVAVTALGSGLTTGTHSATITITCPSAENSPFPVQVNLTVVNATSPPFGEINLPVNGQNVQQTVNVTGWALDDVGVRSVSIYQVSNGGETFLGYADFIEGGKPDIQQTYPNYPANYQAGWGYMLLTNYLPGGPSGTHTLAVKATDVEGNTATLGSRTIICENAHAVKPFGAIDAPAQGGVASGKQYVNSGWVLTPSPNSIPTNGSTIDVYVDGVKVGNPIYNVYRSDIASNYPNYDNSNGAGAYYLLDTTPYANGVHTLSWTASDNAGNTDGIGSRYFTIQNYSSPGISTDTDHLNFYTTQTGQTTPAQTVNVKNAGGGDLPWSVSTDQNWLVVEQPSGLNSGSFSVGVNPALAPTLSLNETLFVSAPNNQTFNNQKTITIHYESLAQSQPPFGAFDSPSNYAMVQGTIPFTGWALDDIGVDKVSIYRQDGLNDVFVGDAVFVEGARPDIAKSKPQYPNNTKSGWGYMMLTNFLPQSGNGTYTFKSVATDLEGNQTILGTKTIFTRNASILKPYGAFDAPVYGETVSGNNYQLQGWALTSSSGTIPQDGSTINVYVDGVNIGHPALNPSQPNLAAKIPGLAKARGEGGWMLNFNTTDFQDGPHVLSFEAADDSGKTGKVYGHYFMIKNEGGGTGVEIAERTSDVPRELTLSPSYPNPFNPSTRITYTLSKDLDVSLTVYDVLGGRISVLRDFRRQTAGTYVLEWDGCSDFGMPAASGVYLLVVKAGSFTQAQKLMLLR